MLNRSDLNAAVSEGIISDDQAKQLHIFAKRLHGEADNLLSQELESRDEPFRLLRGFRDIFIALGIGFLVNGLMFAGLHFGNFSDDTVFVGFSPINALITALWLAIGVGLAEVVTRRLRLPLSSLVLSLAIAVWGGLLVVAYLGYPVHQALSMMGLTFDDGQPTNRNKVLLFLLTSLGGFLSLIWFYWRYRLPFAFLLIAGSVMLFLLALIGLFAPDFVRDNLRYLIGLSGVAIFAGAMAFDVKDRLRVTRFSECGFWLHLIAAPLIVHAILVGDNSAKPALVLTLFAVLVLIALIIDRRALLVSSLAYLSFALYQISKALEFDSTVQFFISSGLIGLTVVLLGVGWTPLRRLVMRAIPNTTFKNYLPPVATSQ